MTTPAGKRRSRRCRGVPAKTVIVMVKDPRLGRAKTRLARETGEVAAVYFYRTLIRNTIARLRSPLWALQMAVASRSGVESRLLPPVGCRYAQCQGDLGRRMSQLLGDAGPGGAIVIGSDIPGITPQHIAEAFRQLRRHDVVFGPALDGGYWLVASKNRRVAHRMFDGVRWSSEHALADTLANLHGARVGFVAALADADVADDVARLAKVNGRLILGASKPVA